jgi:hypothetical protein
MAQKVLVQFVDDLDGSATPDVATVKFSLDGVTYEIDLNAANQERLRKELSVFVEVARRTGGRATRGAAGKVAKGTGVTTNKEQLRAVREWAGKNGIGVSNRGRISAAVLAKFEEAHQS